MRATPRPLTYPRLRELSPRRVCIIKPSALGDVVNAFPTLSALKARWPTAHVSWVINESLRGLVDGHPEIDAVIPYDRKGNKGLGGFARFLRTLRRGGFDLVIDLQGLLRSGLMTAATRALGARRSGRRARRGDVVLQSPNRPLGYARNRARGRPDAGRRLGLRRGCVAADGMRGTRGIRSRLGACGAGERAATATRPEPRRRWETKRWPPAHFADIVRRAASERRRGIGHRRCARRPAVRRPVDRGPRAFAGRQPVWTNDLTATRRARRTRRRRRIERYRAAPLARSRRRASRRDLHVYQTRSERSLRAAHSAVATTVACAGSYLVHCPNQFVCMNDLVPDRVWPAVRDALDAALRML